MSTYETKQASKKARYAEIANKLEARAQQLYELDRQQMDLIPAGQPILIGHHSEARHRAAIARSHSRMNRVLELNEKAAYYRQKALTESNNISSDDEEAINKLKAKLAKLEQLQAEMKRINSEYRKGGLDGITGLSEETKESLKKSMKICPWEKAPFPSWRLTNNNAEIRRVKQRIAELEKAKSTPAREAIKGHGFTVTESKEENRILFQFEEKPSAAVCQLMRKYGFKWSPTRLAWVRMLNQAGRYQVQAVIEAMNKLTLSP